MSLPPLPQKTPATAPVSPPRHRLHAFFRPTSIAVFGASEQAGSTGWRIYENLLQSNFTGKVHAIDPTRSTLFGHPCAASLEALDRPAELAVLALPPQAVAPVLPQLAAAGTRHAVWLLDFQGGTPSALAQQTTRQARELGISLLGADSLGLAHSASGLNLLASNAQVKPGGVALLSQSSAVTSALLDYAQGNGIGLSTVADTGTESGVDLAELLDYLVFDGHTRSIALFVGRLRNPRRFLSALRAAARVKPVVVLSAGRSDWRTERPAGTPRPRLTHAENLTSRDKTLRSALARSGAVIVDGFGELFATLEWLSDNRGVQGNRLAIVSNGGGLARLAEDACLHHGVRIASLTDGTRSRLVLPAVGNGPPHEASRINLGMSCTPPQAAETLRQVVADPQVDAVLGIFQSTLVCDASSLAREILAGPLPNPVLLALVGDADARRGIELLTKDLSVYRAPEDAVRAFSVLAEYQRGQQRLLEVPGPSRDAAHFDEVRIAELLAQAAAAGSPMLDQMASNAVLAACGIPVPTTRIAADIDEAVRLADDIGYPVVLKVQSAEVVHKSDVGGVRLDIRNEEELRNAARAIEGRLQSLSPPPRLDGFLLQPMVPRRHGHEVLVGVSHDTDFGPVLHFGAGGITVELIDDTAIELPPLSPALAHEMIGRTRIARLLQAHHDEPAVDIEALVDVLLAVSALVTRFPAVRALDINPLLVSPDGVMALDARIRLEPAAAPRDGHYSHLAIHPYPAETERRLLARPARVNPPEAPPAPPDTADGTTLPASPTSPTSAARPPAPGAEPPVPASAQASAPGNASTPSEASAPGDTSAAPAARLPAITRPVVPTPMLMRPIRPDDAPRLAAFVEALSDESRLWRFLHPIRVMSPQMMSRFTQVDYDRDMAFVVVEEDGGPEAPIIGVARYFREPSESHCEFAVVILDDWQGRGLARDMMEHLIDTARANGLDTMVGLVHGNNTRMLNFMRRLGFVVSKDPDEPELRQVTLDMRRPPQESAAR